MNRPQNITCFPVHAFLCVEKGDSKEIDKYITIHYAMGSWMKKNQLCKEILERGEWRIIFSMGCSPASDKVAWAQRLEDEGYRVIQWRGFLKVETAGTQPSYSRNGAF